LCEGFSNLKLKVQETRRSTARKSIFPGRSDDRFTELLEMEIGDRQAPCGLRDGLGIPELIARVKILRAG
jgi:hypothetical protein